MKQHRRSGSSRYSFSFLAFIAFLLVLWAAGGASKGDVWGQVVVRSFAWLLLIAGLLFGERPHVGAARPVFIMFMAMTGLAILQLAPLPPAMWQALPGRSEFAAAAILSGEGQPWRPLSIVPWATINAASSLIVPFVSLLMLIGLDEAERRWLPGLILALVAASSVVGLLQFSGSGFDNPLINDSIGSVSSIFANRNHFALFLALGCLIAPIWAFLDGRGSTWRAPIAMALILLFTLTILAVGSRAGLVLGMVAIGLGLLLVREGIGHALRRAPRWAFPATIVAIVVTILGIVILGVAADRAVSIDRIFGDDTGLDRRARSLPTVLAMIEVYFPFGSGFGAFDPLFRLHEPSELLMPTYFNHAHNDFLEIALDGGLPAILLLGAAILWWVVMSVRAWRGRSDRSSILPKLGSAIMLLILLASLVDYPARTPMMMAIIAIAAIWLADWSPARQALPVKEQHL